MKKLLLPVVVVLTAVGLGTAGDADKDLKKLVGTWEEVSHVANGKAKRKETDSPAGKGYLGGDRWHCFSIADVKARDFKLDSFKWLKDDSLEDADELPPPEELATDAIGELEGAVEELKTALALLENGGEVAA